jgi:uncharacterized protein
MSRPTHRRRDYATQAMSLEQLERWIERLEPPPLIENVSMLDGYLTAIIVGPCSINPYEWMGHMLGPHSAIGAEGSEQFAAMQAIAARFNAIGERLATAPRNYAPLFERTDDGIVDAGPWCRGFMAAMMLRPEAWRPLRAQRQTRWIAYCLSQECSRTTVRCLTRNAPGVPLPPRAPASAL